MAFRPFNEQSQPEANDNPWIEDWLADANPAGMQPRPVKQIHAVKSGKGYLLVCDVFNCFVFKRSGMGKEILQWLDKYGIAEEAPSMAVCPLPDRKPCFCVGTDDDLAVKISAPEDWLWTIKPVMTESISGKQVTKPFSMPDFPHAPSPEEPAPPAKAPRNGRASKHAKIVHEETTP